MVDLGHRVVVLEADEPRVPSDDEVKEYADFLGIDVDKEPHLMWIAREGVAAPVPQPWKACRNLDAEHEDEIFYFNFETAESVWDHPCDEKYRSMVEEARDEYELRRNNLAPKGNGTSLGRGLDGDVDARMDLSSGNRSTGNDITNAANELLRSSAIGGHGSALDVLMAGGGMSGFGEDPDAAGILGGPPVILDNIAEEDEDCSSCEVSGAAPAREASSTSALGEISASGEVKAKSDADSDDAEPLQARAGIQGVDKRGTSEEEEEAYEEDYDEDVPGTPSSAASASASCPAVNKQVACKKSSEGKGGESADESSEKSSARSVGDNKTTGKSDAMAARTEKGAEVASGIDAERDRLRPITDEISGDDSIAEAMPDDSSHDGDREPTIASVAAPSGAGSGDSAGGVTTSAVAASRGRPSTGDAAAGGSDFSRDLGEGLASRGGLAPADGAGGPGPGPTDGARVLEPLRGGAAKGLAGVGLAPARAATDLPGSDVRLEAEERASGAGHSGVRSQRSPERLMEFSGQSGRSGRGGSSPASEVSEDFPSQFDNSGLVPEDGGSRQGGGGSKLGDTLELSVTVDGEDPSPAAAAAAAVAAAAATTSPDTAVAGQRVSRAALAMQQAREAGASSAVQKVDNAQSLQAQLESLARSLTMLKDIRMKQQEYMNLLKSGL